LSKRTNEKPHNSRFLEELVVMKNQTLLILASLILALAGCSKGGNDSTAAAVPQSTCGTNGLSSQYCSPYNQSGYGYQNSAYSNYCGQSAYSGGYSNYGWGAQQPCYPQGINYGCGPGFQVMAVGYGGGLVCTPISYLNSLNYRPYYAENYAWAGGYVGWGPAIICDPARGSNDCGYTGRVCYPSFDGTRRGICR
jgi:hypothetical protein